MINENNILIIVDLKNLLTDLINVSKLLNKLNITASAMINNNKLNVKLYLPLVQKLYISLPIKRDMKTNTIRIKIDNNICNFKAFLSETMFFFPNIFEYS